MYSSQVANPPAPIGQAAFRTPLRLTAPAGADHIPLLFWLTEFQRPLTVLGLGLVQGDGYFALAQGLAALDLPARLWGHGPWGTDVPAELAGHNSRHHAAMSRLSPSKALAALRRYGPGMFDLILVETPGLHDPRSAELARALAAGVTARGVIVLQGPPDQVAGLAALMAPARPPLRIGADGDGLLILAGSATDPLGDLLVAPGSAEATSDLPAMLARLGLACRADPRLVPTVPPPPAVPAGPSPAEAALEAALGAARADLAAADSLRLETAAQLAAQTERLTEEIARAEARAAEAQAALSATATELAALRIRHFDAVTDLEAERDWLARDLASARAAVQDLTARLEADRAAHEAQITALKSAAAAEARRLRNNLARQLDDSRAQAAARMARDRVMLRLRDWKIVQLTARGRLDRPKGPGGRPLAAEIAALTAHPLFDADWYRAAYRDVADTQLGAAEHFLRHGFFEGRDPGPRFRLVDWFIAHPEALDEKRNPLLDPALSAAGQSAA